MVEVIDRTFVHVTILQMARNEFEKNPEVEKPHETFIYTWDYRRSGGEVYYVLAITSSSEVEETPVDKNVIGKTLSKEVSNRGLKVEGLPIHITWDAPDYIKKYVNPNDPETKFVFGEVPDAEKSGIIIDIEKEGFVVDKALI